MAQGSNGLDDVTVTLSGYSRKATVLFIVFFVTAKDKQEAHFVSSTQRISVFWPQQRGAMGKFMQCKAYKAVWKVQQARMKLLERKSE